MSVQVKIPAVGESISSGVVSVWHKKSGEQVRKGDPLFTLETDKVSTEIVAEADGVLRTKANEGQEVKIGEVVAEIEESATPAAASQKKEPAPPVAAVVDRGQPESPRSSGATATELSPAVRRIVDEEKLDPSKISGTGKGGRITKGDALAAAQNRAAAVAEEMEATTLVETLEPVESLASAAKDGRVVRKRMSPLRRKIAQQLVMARNTAAILTTFNECDMSEVQALRAYAQEQFTKKNGVKLGLMSFFVKATVERVESCAGD